MKKLVDKSAVLTYKSPSNRKTTAPSRWGTLKWGAVSRNESGHKT